MSGDRGCGSIHSDVLLPVIPERVSTMSPEESVVDYRHFAFTTIGSYRLPLVPLSAYQIDANHCGSACQNVYYDFRPAIIYEFFPGALRSVNPAWEYCSNLRFASLDPPIALPLSDIDGRESAHLDRISSLRHATSSIYSCTKYFTAAWRCPALPNPNLSPSELTRLEILRRITQTSFQRPDQAWFRKSASLPCMQVHCMIMTTLPA